MGLQDTFNKVVDSAKTGLENARDAVNEAGHRSAAEAEQTKRDVAGDQMTVGEKAGSMLNQAKNSTQAEIDAAKLDARTTP
jgi:hypothetical protein